MFKNKQAHPLASSKFSLLLVCSCISFHIFVFSFFAFPNEYDYGNENHVSFFLSFLENKKRAAEINSTALDSDTNGLHFFGGINEKEEIVQLKNRRISH